MVVGHLLGWAENQEEEITVESYMEAKRVVPGVAEYDLVQVDDEIYEALKRTISEDLNQGVGQVVGEGHGLEYWRQLFLGARRKRGGASLDSAGAVYVPRGGGHIGGACGIITAMGDHWKPIEYC